MAYQGEANDNDRASTIDDVQRLCQVRLEQLKAEMAEIELVAERTALQRRLLGEEASHLERVLQASLSDVPQAKPEITSLTRKINQRAHGVGDFYG